MVGLVIFAHNGLAKNFISVLQTIVGPQDLVAAVDVGTELQADEIERKLDRAIKEVDDDDGVIIMADLFGGTPANFSLARMAPGKVEVISGLNLAMLLKAFDLRARNLSDPVAMAQAIVREGRENIVLASQVLGRQRGPYQVGNASEVFEDWYDEQIEQKRTH